MLDINGILSILPHRFPFLLVDRILELEPGKRAVGIKNVTANEPQFTGHWPDNPVMPGVLMVEAMAQVGGIMMMSMDELAGRKLMPLITGITNLKFRRKVMPGDQLRIEAILTRSRGLVGRATIEARVDDEIAVEGEFTFAIIDETEKP